MWARRAAERIPVREYVRRLLSRPAEPKDWLPTIRNDATLSPLRKIVAIEIADAEVLQIGSLYDALVAEKLSKSRLLRP